MSVLRRGPSREILSWDPEMRCGHLHLLCLCLCAALLATFLVCSPPGMEPMEQGDMPGLGDAPPSVLESILGRRRRLEGDGDNLAFRRKIGALAVSDSLEAVDLVEASRGTCSSYLPAKSCRVHQRIDWEAHCANQTRGEFRARYRMSKRCFNLLLETVRPMIETAASGSNANGDRPALTPEARLAMTLRYLAGASYLDVCLIYGCCRRSVHNQIDRVVDAIQALVGDSKDPYAPPYDTAFHARMKAFEQG